MNGLSPAAVSLMLAAEHVVRTLPTRIKINTDDVEVVFLDNVNGRMKPRRARGFLEVIEALNDGSTPIGFLLICWTDAEKITAKPMDALSNEGQAALAHALAEAQDEARETDEEHA